jgi:hypothetical protein
MGGGLTLGPAPVTAELAALAKLLTALEAPLATLLRALVALAPTPLAAELPDARAELAAAVLVLESEEAAAAADEEMAAAELEPEAATLLDADIMEDPALEESEALAELIEAMEEDAEAMEDMEEADASEAEAVLDPEPVMPPMMEEAPEATAEVMPVPIWAETVAARTGRRRVEGFILVEGAWSLVCGCGCGCCSL